MGYVDSCSPALLAHLLGFTDLLSQLLFLAVEVALGDTFLICFVLTLSTNQYCFSTRNRCLHITNHLLLLLHELAIADLPFVKIQNRLKIANVCAWHLTKVFCMAHPINVNQIHVLASQICSESKPSLPCARAGLSTRL